MLLGGKGVFCALANLTGELAALRDTVTEARRQAELAYQFSPGSYAHAAFIAAMKAESILGEAPDDGAAS